MKVRWKRNYPAEHAFGVFTDPDEVIEVDADLGKKLLTQPDNWEQVSEPKPKKKTTEEGDS